MRAADPDPRVQLEPGTPLAEAVTAAHTAFAGADVVGLERSYTAAVALAGTDRLRLALAADHVARLLHLGRISTAHERCGAYLARFGRDQPRLRLLRAEIHSAGGAHALARAEIDDLRTDLDRGRADPIGQGGTQEGLTRLEQGRMLRVEALAAADGGDVTGATTRLAAARQVFHDSNALSAVAGLDRDLLLIDLRQGFAAAVADVLGAPPTRTVADQVLLATALKRELRYEEALGVLRAVLSGPDLDPALRVPLLADQVVLLRLTRQDEEAAALLPMLAEATTTALDPVHAEQVVARLSPRTSVLTAGLSGVEQVLQRARLLVEAAAPERSENGNQSTDQDQIRDQDRIEDQDRIVNQDQALAEAASVLAGVRSQAATVRQQALWQLAAGELALARHRSRQSVDLQEAVDHLAGAAELAAGTAMTEVRVVALRTLGRALVVGTDPQAALACWAEAHRLEETVAARQLSDDVRIGMLLGAPDEHDERIRAAAAAWSERGPVAAAGLVLALDAARGATILDAIGPGPAAASRRRGFSTDDQAWRWLREINHGLPRSQMLWMMHSTPERVHHVLIGRGLLHHTGVAVARRRLVRAVEDLTACWDPLVLESSIDSGEFDSALAAIAALIGIDDVMAAVPPSITRAAFVLGGELAEIPLAAIPLGGGAPQRLGHRFAVSELPCVAARRPLQQRSHHQRGDRVLLVGPAAHELTSAAALPGSLLLEGPQATPAAVVTAVGSARVRQVRIDSHGEFQPDEPARSWLQLAPPGEAGRVYPHTVRDLDLRRCGTLVLGACETGMMHRRGRDEAAGFVRAGIIAGAASVVAAKWAAEDSTATTVLDRFHRYLRWLPRDLALQRAQRDVAAGADVGAGDRHLDHPARWACWTLYGDAGWQTGAAAPRRRLRQRREAAGPDRAWASS